MRKSLLYARQRKHVAYGVLLVILKPQHQIHSHAKDQRQTGAAVQLWVFVERADQARKVNADCARHMAFREPHQEWLAWLVQLPTNRVHTHRQLQGQRCSPQILWRLRFAHESEYVCQAAAVAFSRHHLGFVRKAKRLPLMHPLKIWKIRTWKYKNT